MFEAFEIVNYYSLYDHYRLLVRKAPSSVILTIADSIFGALIPKEDEAEWEAFSLIFLRDFGNRVERKSYNTENGEL